MKRNAVSRKAVAEQTLLQEEEEEEEEERGELL